MHAEQPYRYVVVRITGDSEALGTIARRQVSLLPNVECHYSSR